MFFARILRFALTLWQKLELILPEFAEIMGGVGARDPEEGETSAIGGVV